MDRRNDVITPDELQFKEPYVGKKKYGTEERRVCSWKTPRRASGCYVIKENGQVVYVGMSRSALYLTAYRHFQSWHGYHKGQYRVCYKWKLDEHKYELGILECDEKQAAIIENFWIQLLNPRDNRKVKLPEPEEDLPF